MFKRAHRAIVVFALLLTAAVPGWGHDRAFFGYAFELYGWLLPASYAGGRFYKESGDVARRFPIGIRVSAVTNLGERTRFVLRRPEPDVHGNVSYKLRCVGTCPKGRAVLFWTGNVSLQPLRARKTKLDSTSLVLLRKQAAVLYRRALTHYEFKSIVQEMQLGTPVSEAVEGVSGIITVTFPVTLRRRWSGTPDVDVDTRASVFFIYLPSRQKIMYGTFGHPEWGAAEDVFQVEPLIYFRIHGDPKPYFFGNWSGPWESGGGGIFDLRTGRKIALEDPSPD